MWQAIFFFNLLSLDESLDEEVASILQGCLLAANLANLAAN